MSSALTRISASIRRARTRTAHCTRGRSWRVAEAGQRSWRTSRISRSSWPRARNARSAGSASSPTGPGSSTWTSAMRISARPSPSWPRDFARTEKGYRRASRLRLLRRQLSRMQEELESVTARERKRDAHEKIQLGGLVVKAGLRELDQAVLFGAMLELADL